MSAVLRLGQIIGELIERSAPVLSRPALNVLRSSSVALYGDQPTA
jgi:hypothetical protein